MAKHAQKLDRRKRSITIASSVAGVALGAIVTLSLTASGQTGGSVQGDQTCSFSILAGVVSPLACVAAPTTEPTTPPATTTVPPTTIPPTTAPPTSPSASETTPPSGDYPDASTTGVLAGKPVQRVPEDITSGAGWKVVNGNVIISGNGAVFTGYQVSETVQITGANVTVSNNIVQFLGGGGNNFGIELRHAKNATIEHNQISAMQPSGGTDTGRLTAGIKDIFFDSTGTKILANDIADASCGIQTNSGLVQDNYVHNLASQGNDHVNAVLSGSAGPEPLIVRHNTLLNQLGQNSAVAFYEDGGSQGNHTVDNNLLGGGGYVIYEGGGDHSGIPNPPNMAFTNNQFTTRYAAKGGYYGPVAYPVSGATWSGNVWADGPNAGHAVTQ